MTNIEALKIAQRIERNLLRIRQMLDLSELQKGGEADMPVSPQAAALISQFDDATNAIAARIAALVSAQPGISADDQAAFQAEVDKLKSLGADPNNPVPPAATV